MKVLAGQPAGCQQATPCCCSTPTASTWRRGGRPAGPGPPPWATQRLRVYSPSPQAGQASLLRLSLAELTVDDLRTAWKFTGPQSEPWSAYALLGDKGCG